MKEKDINCSGFNFYCQEDKSYVIFDPQSQEENDRLDALLGATELWDAAIEKRKNELHAGDYCMGPFVELLPVGWTSTDEVVSVVLQGVIGIHDRKVMVNGGWFAVRCKPDGDAEVRADLEVKLNETKAFLEKGLEEAY